jgi:hypothetical protein
MRRLTGLIAASTVHPNFCPPPVICFGDLDHHDEFFSDCFAKRDADKSNTAKFGVFCACGPLQDCSFRSKDTDICGHRHPVVQDNLTAISDKVPKGVNVPITKFFKHLTID